MNTKTKTPAEIAAAISAPYKPAEGEMPTAFTEDEVRERFLRHMHSLIAYWNGEKGSNADPDAPPRRKLEGLAFSIMSTLDGCSMNFPRFSVMACPHESDEQYHKDSGERWYPKGVDIAGCLHELFDKYRPEDDE